MSEKRAVNIASVMMLIWLAFYLLAVFVLPKWGGFFPIVGCTVPMLVFSKSARGATFGARDCNTVKYPVWEYAAFFVFCIGGCALLSALSYIASGLLTASPIVPRGDFPYLFVFSCFLPAFFEEWLVRGGVLGAVAQHGSAGVWFCSLCFMLMHADFAKWPYALFAGLLITALVYTTECIYLGMLLHFTNNLTALLLSYLPDAKAEYIALAVIAVLFVAAFLLLRRAHLGKDVWALLRKVEREDVKALLSPLFFMFAAAVILLILYKEML